MRWIEALKNAFRKPVKQISLIELDGNSLKPDAPQDVWVVKIMEYLQTMEDEERYTCSQVYQLLDQYAEAAMRGEDVSQLMPLVKKHLEMCIGCNAQYEALLHILESV